ncbi:metallophosphoesterase [Bacillus taeanensis]|uniref:Metallophosphoesterase n=1 Tax=Bacillus taeanensis TaxID=273032 RepID=A0A366Y1W8_9BACI|nr:metallophosphoesterase [Bacillus taeanensis]RBW70403.1 metallophosphoesterase [Bacillus taeanensis]
MWIEAHLNNVNETIIYLQDFPKGFENTTIFFISDVHRRKIHDNILSKIRGRADFIVIGGDLAEKGVPYSRIEQNIKKLTKIAPVYFVWGNNDYEVDYHKLDAMLLDCGVKILDNTAVSFESDNELLNLLGVDDPTGQRDNLDLALQDSGNGFRILISHNPSIVNKITSLHKIGLVISGHTHGGQIRIWKWGLEEKGGVKYCKQTTLFVSNGYGTTMLPLRLGVPAETNLLTLKSK